MVPAAFALVYTAVCVGLEWGGVVLYTRPAAFALMLSGLWLWQLDRAGMHSLGRARGVIALLMRLTVLGVLAMILAEPRALRQGEGLGVIYVLDRSDSIADPARESALEWMITTAGARAEGDRAGLVVFARDAAVELPPRTSFPFEAVNSRLEGDGTDLATALSLAGAMLDDDAQGRIVLVSDGTATAGAVDPILDDLRQREIPVDVLPIDYRLKREVWLDGIELPRQVLAGETYEASVVLSALSAGSGTLILRENGTVIAEQEVDYTAGKNRYRLPLYLRQAGYYEYVASIATAPEDDFWRANNTAIGHIHLRGEGQVLLVVDPNGEASDHEHLARALREAGRVVDVKPGYELPRNPMALVPYDAVVVVGCPADAIDLPQQRALRDAVYHLGIGLVMVGGPGSFGPGGYHRTPVEEALPVSMDITNKKVLPKGALAIILHTCEFPQGNTWAKRITRQAIKVLGAEDEVGVLIYDWDKGGDSWLFELTPAAEYAKLSQVLEGAQIGDMPSFQSSMQLGLAGLKNSDAAAKHMIIISDGDASPPTPAVLNDFVAEQISISTVTVFPHGNQPTQVMPAIARATGGRHYYPNDPQQLPAIFIKEAKTLKRSMIQNVDFVPDLGQPSSVMRGIDSMPPLAGYVIATLKPRARQILLRATEDDDPDPVLAVWKHGLGTSAAFTSDLGGRWAKAWLDWDRYRAFCDQLVAAVSRASDASQLSMRVENHGSTAAVVVEDHANSGDLLDFAAQVLLPDGETAPLSLQQVGPGRYAAEFPIAGRGHYQVLATGLGADRSERAAASLVVPYAREYLRFRADPMALQHIAKRTGGRELSPDAAPETLWQVDRIGRRHSSPIIDLLLVALACLIPLDVALRRIQIDWAALFERLRRRERQESTATMGALLARKQQVGTPRGDSPAQARASQPRSAPAARSTAKPAAPKPVSDKPAGKKSAAPPAADDGSTMSRLLARKRQLREEQDGDER
ncbi:MAG: VWA domain-containing protein [Planctomycetota bacterium]|nr:VWA domain-containing protein [Planctomycetota bacterium]